MPRRPLIVALASLMALCAAACLSDEDRAHMKRKVELDTAQAAIAKAGSCADARRALDAWWTTHGKEAKALDRWWLDLSNDHRRKLISGHRSAWFHNLDARAKATMRCGFVPWNTRRKPDDPPHPH